MADRIPILETSIDTEKAGTFFLQLTAEVAEEKDGLLVTFEYRDQNGFPLCNVSFKGTISNPIDFGAIIVSAATFYGICVAVRYAGSTAKIIWKTYQESKANNPDAGISDRSIDVVQSLPEKSEEFKAEAVSVLTGCALATIFPGD